MSSSLPPESPPATGQPEAPPDSAEAVDGHTEQGDGVEEEEEEREEENEAIEVEARARPRGRRQRRQRRNKICVAFILLGVLVAVSAPLILTRSTYNSVETENILSMEVISEALLDIASDSGHSCAIREGDRSVFCWGNQIGVPANLFEARQIAVGDGFSCAIQLSNDALVCWGDDSYADFVQPPSDMAGVSFVTASGGTVCAVERNSGMGRCWGFHDQYGRVEFSIPESSSGPLKSIAAPKKGNIHHLCAIREADDIVQCWSISLQFDDRDEALIEFEESQKIAAPVTSVAVMEDFLCAVSIQDASLQCWAFNDTADNVHLPEILPGTTYTRVFPGNRKQFCAIQTDGSPICFGDNGKPIFIPSQVGPVKQIAVGVGANRNHFCAIRQDLGYGVCWGRGASPGLLAPLESAPIYAKDVAAGNGRMCAIGIYRDTVDCWGSKRYQLLVSASGVSLGEEVTCVVDSVDDYAKCVIGDGTFVLDRKVKQVEVSQEDLICTVGKYDDSVRCYRTNCQRATFQNYLYCTGVPNFIGNPEYSMGAMVQDLKLSQRHYCVVRKYTRNLECGTLANLASANETVPEARVPSDLLAIKDVALGRFFTCVVQDNNEIVCFGDETKYGSEYVLNPPRGKYYRAIAATDYEACAITLDNFVHCWGRPFISSIYVPSDVRFVDRLRAGSGHFCAVLANSQVLCWGSNRNGELSMDYVGS